MAELSEQDRQRIWRGLMRYWSRLFEEADFNNVDFRAAINATDVWIDNNQASYNTALPDPFKTNATQAQKTLLFCVVTAMRASPAFAQQLVGEVD